MLPEGLRFDERVARLGHGWSLEEDHGQQHANGQQPDSIHP